MVAKGNEHKGRPYRRWRAAVLATYPPICHRCGKGLKFGVYHDHHPLYPTADHVIPVALGGARLDVRNGRPMHYGCNSSKGARLGSDPPMPTSRSW